MDFKGDTMKNLLFTLLTVTFFASCNGSSEPRTAPQGDSILSHGRVASLFLEALNLNSDFSFEVVKLNTEQDGFVLVYDPLSDTFEAIDVSGFDARNGDALAYYQSNPSKIYRDIEKIAERYETQYEEQVDYYLADGTAVYKTVAVEVFVPTVYRERSTGITFEKTASSAKDLAKVVAIKEAAELQKSAEFLSSEFGLSLSRGKELAGLKAHWKKSSKKGMTNSEIDAFSTELLGFSLTSGMEALRASQDGDESQVESLVEQAATVNGITPEHASQLMTKVFGL